MLYIDSLLNMLLLFKSLILLVEWIKNLTTCN